MILISLVSRDKPCKTLIYVLQHYFDEQQHPVIVATERELDLHVQDLDVLVRLGKVYNELLSTNFSNYSVNGLFLGSLRELAEINYKTGFLNKKDDEPPFWEPEVVIKGYKAKCLVVSGASCSVLSAKFL